MDSAPSKSNPDGESQTELPGLPDRAEHSPESAIPSVPAHIENSGDRAIPVRSTRRSKVSRLIAWSSGWEYSGAILLTVAALALHVVLYRHAGGLWRDEINSVGLAAMTTLADVWNHIEYDSFPIFWVLVLRCWQGVVGDGDTGYRFLGLCVGLGCLATLWRATRHIGHGPPLLSLALVGLSPIMLRFGDSLRAWGFGVMWMWLMVTAMWDYSRAPTRGRWWSVAILGLLSVQASYYNAILLFAAAVGGCAVCGVRRDWKTIWRILGAGVIAAISLLPYYAPIARHRSWVILVEVDMSLPELLERWGYALDAAGPHMLDVWCAICLLGLVGGLLRWFWPDLRQNANRDVALFSIVSLLVGSVLYLLLIKQMHRLTESWYYLTWMAFTGLLIDVAFTSLCGANPWLRFARVSAAVAVGVNVLPAAWNDSQLRYTNIDLIAKHLSETAKPGDLVAVLYWETGITFERYYSGKARWLTVPNIDDHRIHRYDLIKKKMEDPNSIDEPIKAAFDAIDSGGRVWVVGDPSLDPEFVPRKLAPPPLPDSGWHYAAYGVVWMKDFKYYVWNHIDSQNEYSVGIDVPTSNYERFLVEMWQKRE